MLVCRLCYTQHILYLGYALYSILWFDHFIFDVGGGTSSFLPHYYSQWEREAWGERTPRYILRPMTMNVVYPKICAIIIIEVTWSEICTVLQYIPDRLVVIIVPEF